MKNNKPVKKSLKNQIKDIKVDTYTKLLVSIIIIVALIDLQLSYILAFLDKVQIAESLSTQICITILGTAFIYMIRAYFDSRAEHNNDNTIQKLQQDIGEKVQSVLNNNGISVNVNDILLDPDAKHDIELTFSNDNNLNISNNNTISG